MNIDDVKKLATLSRLELTDEETNSYVQDFEGILSYIDTLKECQVQERDSQSYVVTNVMREDDNEYTPGEFSEDLMNEAPETKEGFVQVKKIL